MTTLSEYRASKELFYNLTLRDLRSKYKRSFLGWTWSLINPLVNTLVYTVVFAYFLKVQIPPGRPSGLHLYALHLLCAMLPWNFFVASVTGSIGSLIGNGNLIKKSYFPRSLLPSAMVAGNLVSHGIEMTLLLFVLVCFGDYQALYYLPVTALIVFLIAIFGLGLGLAVSALNVYFRDIEHFMNILFLVWFYATPVVYPISVVPGKLLLIDKLNPMTDASISLYATLYNGTHPGVLQMIYLGAAALVALVIGLKVFTKLEGRLAEEL